jgi:hypothetical protein
MSETLTGMPQLVDNHETQFLVRIVTVLINSVTEFSKIWLFEMTPGSLSTSPVQSVLSAVPKDPTCALQHVLEEERIPQVRRNPGRKTHFPIYRRGKAISVDFSYDQGSHKSIRVPASWRKLAEGTMNVWLCG